MVALWSACASAGHRGDTAREWRSFFFFFPLSPPATPTTSLPSLPPSPSYRARGAECTDDGALVALALQA